MDVSSFTPTTVSEATGKRYRFDEHKAGTAAWVRDRDTKLDPESEKNMKSAVEFITSQMRRLGLREHKVIVFADTLQRPSTQNAEPVQPLLSNVFEIDEGFAGHYVGFDNNVSVIALSTLQKGVGFRTAAVHEFGHFLVHRRFRQTDPATQQKIYARYRHDLLSATFGDYRNAGRFAGVTRRKLFPELESEEVEVLTPVKAAELLGQDLGYLFSFDEWVAEQIVKHFTGAAQKGDDVGGFFSSVARELRELFERAKKFFGLEAVPEVRDWVESFAQNKSPISLSALSEGEAKGENENAEILSDVTAGESVPPPQAATQKTGSLLTRLGVPGGQARKIRTLGDKYSWFAKMFYSIQQIAKLNPGNFFFNRHVELIDQWHIFQMKWISRAEDRIREWKSLGLKGGERLSRFLFAIDAMEYLTPTEKANEVVRQPTNDELVGLAKKYELTAAGLETFYRVREDFQEVLKQIEQTSLRDIARTITDPIVQQQQIEELQKEMENFRKRPYFPHSRFGKYVVVAKDAKGATEWSEHFPTKGSARDAVSRVQAQFKGSDIRVDFAEVPEGAQVFFGLPPALLSKIRNNLELTPVQRQYLDNLIVEMAPSASFRHKLQKRANVPGHSMDAMRAYADYFFFGSRHLARIEYGPLIDENIEEYGREINATELIPRAPVDVVNAKKMRNMLVNHREHIMNPKPDWAGLRVVAAHWYLGFNVSSAGIQFLQVPMVAWPYLAARFGDVKSFNALLTAMRDIRSFYKYKDLNRVSDSEFKIIQRGMQEGVIRQSQAAELAGQANQQYLGSLLPGPKIQQFFQKIGHYSMWMFTQAERLNRSVVFQAAMKLTLNDPNAKHVKELQRQNQLEMDQLINQDGFSHLEALAYLSARDAVHTTQFQYSRHARPEFMRGRKGSFLVFYMFTQNMLYFATHDPGKVRFLVMMLFMAGLMGLPGADDLASIAKILARNILGKEFNVEREVRSFVLDMFGDAIPPDLILHGVGRIGLGMGAVADIIGIPKADIDISRRIGLGRVIPGLHELSAPGMDFDRAMSSVTTQAAGAAFGMGFNMWKALEDESLSADDFKRWERAMPSSIGNLTRMFRYWREERERSRTGATIVDFDMTDPDHIAETIARGLGFQPTRLAREWDRVSALQEVQKYWATRRGSLLRLFNSSFDTDNSNLRETILEDIRRFNGEVPFGSIAISGETLRKSRMEHARQRRLREAGLTKEKAYRPLAREIEALFPETRKIGEVNVESTGGMR